MTDSTAETSILDSLEEAAPTAAMLAAASDPFIAAGWEPVPDPWPSELPRGENPTLDLPDSGATDDGTMA